MSVLSIDKAKLPDGCSATPAAGGNLTPDTTYYYRVAAVTDEGETCACPAFSGTTTSTNKTLSLSWNKVSGVKATGGYRVYRNTQDSWETGDLLLATVDTNSFTDDGSITPTSGVPVRLESDRVTAVPEEIPSLIAEVNIPGREGGDVQYLGSPPQRLRIEGGFRGSSAKANLDRLRAVRAAGIACEITILSHGQTWIQAYYLVASLSWWLEPGAQNVSGVEKVRFLMELIA